MIPLTLHLKNFLSYGDLQTINFAPHHLICLSGKNGHGKSALLDAITWAIWGQARKVGATSKPDEGLVRLGQTSMMVCLDFVLAGQTYRVRREFTWIRSKGQLALDFGVLNPQDGSIISLTDKTIRGTQEKINSTLHLTYESFINSAFLRQGQANEFSKKSAKERKEVLAAILDLGQYDLVRKLAMEKSKEALAEQQSQALLREKFLQECAKQEECTREMNDVTAQLQIVTTRETTLSTEKQLLEQRKKKHAQDNAQLQQELYSYRQLQATQTQELETFRSLIAEWRSINAQQHAVGDLAAFDAARARAFLEVHTHQQTLQAHLECKEQLLKKEQALHKVVHEYEQICAVHTQEYERSSARITHEHATITTRMHSTEQTIAALQQEEKIIRERIAHEQKACAAFDKEAEMRTQHAEQFERRKAFYHECIAQGNHLANELRSIKQKQAFVHDEHDPSCPLCEQNLSATRRRFLRTKFEHAQDLLEHQLARATRVIEKLKKMLVDDHTKLEQQQKAAQEQHARGIQIEELKKQQEKIGTHIAQLREQQTKDTHLLTELNAQKEQLAQQQTNRMHVKESALKELPAYQAAYADYEHCTNLIASHRYDAQAHKQAQESLNQYEQQRVRIEALRSKLQEQKQRRARIDALCEQLKARKKELSACSTIALKEIELQKCEQELHTQERVNSDALHALFKEREIILEKRGCLLVRQETIAQAHSELAKQEKMFQQLQQNAADYQAIAAATGKDGIQALLIEQAIPEIEQEANEILSRLTNNQAQIFIESLRDLKKGGTKETLDIKISDPAGIRPYEMFSGGEAFRIDFALRIAISKFLARRSGTALQTLIIDEGFGSQDDEGLTHIMDAIYTIQEDFAMVIIVSHLGSMKEQFPVHFLVQKGAQGSCISVIEQG